MDLNPPPVLTSGDRVDLPVTVRNYTAHEQKVAVELQQNEWSKVDGTLARRLTVAPNSSANVAYSIQAVSTSGAVWQRVTAVAGKDRDAIEKPIRIHPDGQEVKQTIGDLMSGRLDFNVTIPPAAIPGATRGEIRLYPNVLAMLLESAGAILITPHVADRASSRRKKPLSLLHHARAIEIPRLTDSKSRGASKKRHEIPWKVAASAILRRERPGNGSPIRPTGP
jgi:hypothetical protein